MKKREGNPVIGKPHKKMGSSLKCYLQKLGIVIFSLIISLFAASVQSGLSPSEIKSDRKRLQMGRSLVLSTQKGNCIACHSIPNDKQIVTLANIGPPLIGIKERFPSRMDLKNQLWDPTLLNPNTIMPPFGKHKILTNSDIELILDYLYSL